MAGDYTRLSFRPERDFSALLKQQGRVDLDADWNELVDIFRRRIWTETVDLIGRCAIPRDPADVFKIVAAGGGYTIGIGRAYVDGLQPENHGTGAIVHEPIWGDPTGSQPVDYAHQPYLDPAPAVPGGAGPHLFYLDVWEREVTAVEEPDIVEAALGVDTTTRRQTVWQVKILPNLPAGTKCSSDWGTIPAWVSLTTPSGGLLTTQGVGVSTPADPCLIPPTGGYRGLENRLYRVEIHDDGSVAGKPLSFKWSRDNASVAAVIKSIANPGGAAPKVTVDRIGRDSILRFAPGDWVELIDDVLELSGQPGVMARIAPQGVDATTNTITLTAALGGAIDTTRNARLRRWDQQAGVNAAGVIPVGALPATFQLEDGVQVTFDLAAAGLSFHAADSWSFAARVANAWVEPLTDEPPQAIRHHYCRLAILANGQLEDCRPLYPPLPPPCDSCECDACISPEDQLANPMAIQEAVTKVGKLGGKVCLCAGIYRLRKPIVISKAHSLTLAGKGHRTVLLNEHDGPAIEIVSSAEVTVSNLLVATKKTSTKSKALRGAIEIQTAIGTTIERCFIGQLGALVPFETGPTLPYPGIGIGLGRLVAETVIRENVVLTDVGVAVLAAGTALTYGAGSDAEAKKLLETIDATHAGRYLVTHGLWIEDNLLLCRHAGVDLGRAGDTRKKWAKQTSTMIVHIGDTTIAGNAVYGADEVGVIVSGAVVNAKYLAPAAKLLKGLTSGLKLAGMGARLDVRSNLLSVTGDGIVIASDQARIEDNDVISPSARSATDGIRLAAGATGRILDAAQIVANRVTGFSQNGIAVVASPRSCLVKLNQIEKTGINGIFVSPTGGKARSGRVAIENNQILGVGVSGRSSVYGIYASAVSGLRIAGNAVAGVGQNADESPDRVGIEIDACPGALVADNQVSGVGPTGAALATPTIGIHSAGVTAGLDVADNQVDLTDAGDGDSYVLALQIGDLVERVEIGDHVYDRVAGEEEHLAVDLPDMGDPAPPPLAVATYAATAVTSEYPAMKVGDELWVIKGRGIQEVLRDNERITVHGNVLGASGRYNVAWVTTAGTCLFSDNRCRLEGGAESSYRAAVLVVAEAAAVVASANQIIGSARYDTALDINKWTQTPATVVGNVVDADILLNSAALQSPWDGVNVKV
jgi:hypothetical protein